MNPMNKKPIGFATMTPEKRQAIASMGGRASHAKGTSHKWTSETARLAGRKGGMKAAAIPGRMAEVGRLGGLAAKQKRDLTP